MSIVCRSTLANEVMAAGSTLSTAAEVTVQRTVALLPAASQSVAQKEVEVINEADEASVPKESVYESSILVTFYVFSIIFIGCVCFYSP